MIWLTSPDAIAPHLPAAWLIATGEAPANLVARSALRRGTARTILSRQLRVPAAEIGIAHDANGRPLLEAPGHAGLHISLATRGGFVAIALAQRPVGIDVERVDPALALPLGALHPRERTALLALPAATRALDFARLWSAKEAYVKALGLGFVRAPESFCVILGEDESLAVDDPDCPGVTSGLGRIIKKNGGQEILAAAMVTMG